MSVLFRVTLLVSAILLVCCQQTLVANELNGETREIVVANQQYTAQSSQTDYQEGAGDGEEPSEAEGGSVHLEPMQLLASVNSVEEFIHLLRTDEGSDVTTDDIFSEYDSDTGKRVIQGGGRMAEPDECSPRNTTVQLQMNMTDSREIYFPRCTRVQRCGGCNPTPYLKCVSAYTERISLTVIKAKAPRPGSTHLVFSGIAPVIVDRHVRCVIRCTLTPEICGPKKVVLTNQCLCKCKSYSRCRTPQVFNREKCRCQCPGRTRTCCPYGYNCGLVFDQKRCACILYTGKAIISNRDFPIASKSTYYDVNDEENDTLAPSFPTAPTTTATMPTTAAAKASAAEKCVHLFCPRSFIKVLVRGNCRCRPTRRFTRYRVRGRAYRPTGK